MKSVLVADHFNIVLLLASTNIAALEMEEKFFCLSD